ncbi:Crp/Fnr family transcriptional regulator [Candidatus Galacturonibacter soehngenii]|uniref:Crp/Fnr family transcriptional regulator n=1 Tax=Candidatus Galacturonatibacter soehngenii TaxID=2307010 RepID=A0A7V7QLL6_9FIRM|nr:Crp/Fnr family transcriptional regulator [Candidatus Galacturonibacter soehngenii]KAB1438466.1 Crp/Fnr family transcriptional regulator [Candidatus Galacturonibacter soehngenii]MBA4687626.1 Crp/Fnr family transcriptional regulator [Candidatus Galacturonibacter soehngenii]
MEHSCNNCNRLCTSRITLFEPLSREEQIALVEKAKHLDYKKGETIFHESDQADRIMIIRYGKVKMNHYSLEGKEYVFDILVDNDIYGEQNIFAGKTFEANAITLTETGVCLISLKDIKELILKRPEIGIKILNVIGEKLSFANELVQLLSINDAKARVAGFILFQSNKIKSKIIELTREDIAAHINVRRETISRKLGELQKDGIILLQGNKKIEVLQKELLRDIFENGK